MGLPAYCRPIAGLKSPYGPPTKKLRLKPERESQKVTGSERQRTRGKTQVAKKELRKVDLISPLVG